MPDHRNYEHLAFEGMAARETLGLRQTWIFTATGNVIMASSRDRSSATRRVWPGTDHRLRAVATPSARKLHTKRRRADLPSGEA